MKKAPILLSLIAAMSLSGCALFKKLQELMYKDLDTFFSENNYTRSDSASEFNSTMQGHVFVWSEKTQTYTNTDNVDTFIYSPRGDSLVKYDRYDQITIRSKFGESFVILTSATASSTFISYTYEDQPKVLVTGDLTMRYTDSEGYLVDMDDEHRNLLRVSEHENGYLFVSSTDFMFFITKGNMDAYLCVNASATFSNSKGTFSVPSSALLTETLAKLQSHSYELFTLPIPSSNSGIYHKDYYSETNQQWLAYDVILPYINIFDYVKLIEDSGLEIYRGENHPLTQIGRDRGGEWVFYDKNHEACIHLQDQNPIAATKNDSNNYGVRMRIQRAEDKFSYYGCTVNSQTDWADDEKQFMSSTFGVELPFINLGRRYHVVTTKRDNGESPLDSPLAMDVQCYWIFDNFFKDVITETYGQKLIDMGFRQYVAPDNIKGDASAYSAWEYSDDYKFYECYLYEETGIAVKISFDDIYGNTIRIFNIDELQPWWIYA